MDTFWSKVNKTKTCWLWTAGTNRKGYGQIRFQGKLRIATRVSYELNTGKSPGKQHVLHKCDTPACVKPSHLFLGDNSDNQRDSVAKGRHYKTRMSACGYGHPYIEDNFYTNHEGHRVCRVCRKIRVRAWRARLLSTTS